MIVYDECAVSLSDARTNVIHLTSAHTIRTHTHTASDVNVCVHYFEEDLENETLFTQSRAQHKIAVRIQTQKYRAVYTYACTYYKYICKHRVQKRHMNGTHEFLHELEKESNRKFYHAIERER